MSGETTRGASAERHDVVVVGAGPTGLMLAGELALGGVDVAVVERRTERTVVGTRARGMHARTLEVFDQRGILERFLAEGTVAQTQGFAGIRMDIGDFPSRHPHGLALWQCHTERLLEDWILERGVPVRRGVSVVDFTEHAEDLEVALDDDSRIRARYLVGCDGGRSTLRKRAGIQFVGFDPTTSWIMGEVRLEEPRLGLRDEGGGIGPAGEGRFGVVLPEPALQRGDDPTEDQLRVAMRAAYGTDFALREPRWIARFTDMTRQAATYRSGRVLLAGDAAHVHPPQGGQGLNTGVQDAVNLGWKLAQVIAGVSPDSLLDSYHSERHPVAARVLHNTRAQVALNTPGESHRALRELMTELLAMEGPRKHVAAMLTALDVAYDLGGGHPLVGRRMPDVDLVTPEGATRVATLLHRARPVLLTFGERAFDLARWPRIRLVTAERTTGWELPVLGAVPETEAVAIRPDGHVAWAGDLDDPSLPQVLSRWFGPDATDGRATRR